jgi:LL-diaminopimelate aminotransferase
MAFVEPGDIALVPDPGYPVYSVGTLFSGGESYYMPLMEGNQWFPDLGAIPEDVANKATIMWLNYPNNPTGATAELNQFAKAIEFARRHNIVLMHDACYSEIAYDGYRPLSILQVEGARDVGVEFHSLSKSYNMTGWRLGMAVCNRDIIEALRVIKSNMDSGVPQAIQQMGMAAMAIPDAEISDRNEIYHRRRDLVVEALRDLDLTVEHPKASLYIWAGVPEGFTSAGFSERLLEETDVLVSPGTSYGKWGEGYIRLSLTLSDDQLEKAVDRLSNWTI